MRIKDIRGGTIFYDESGNKYIKLGANYKVDVPHCCNGTSKSTVNCLLIIEGILMWLNEEDWVTTKEGF